MSWKQFANKQKNKRTTKGKKQAGECSESKDEIVVQRMSSEVSGKQQKYSRIGAREYVPFTEYDELNFENIKEACKKYFAPNIDKDMVCDILAGERGPSCKKMAHVPDLKVFYVRFVKPQDIDAASPDDEDDPDKPKPKRTRYGECSSLPSPKKQACTSKFYPKSLSVVDMLKLGRVISNKTSTAINIYKFDMELMEWSTVPLKTEFILSEEPFASGGFRNAFKATSKTPGFHEVTWVVKKYSKRTLDGIYATKQTPEEHTKKAVQMHYLAGNFASQLKDKIVKEELTGYGHTFQFKKVFLGKTEADEYVTIEEFIDGEFVKYINNNGDLCVEFSDMCDKAQSFAHFTYDKSDGKVMVLDIQGAGHMLYDPEIASAQLQNEEGAYQFCTGNLAEIAIHNFFFNHQCNRYCKLLSLKLRPN